MSRWSCKRLAELCSIEIGRTPARDNPKYWDTDKQTDNVWVSIADMGKAVSASIHGSKEHLSDAGAAITPLVPKGALLLSFKLSLGKLAFAGRPLRTNEAIAALIPDDARQINIKFLYWYLHSFDWVAASRGSEKIKGATLNKAKLKEITVPLPPLFEQKRIVAILDEAFEGIDTAIASTEKNLANARELFESCLQAVFARRGAAWDKITLEKLLDRGWIEGHLDGNHGNDYPHKEDFVSEGVPYISANCVIDDHIDMARAKYLTADRAALLRKGIARDGDVLFAHNATVGPVTVLRTSHEKVILSTSLTYYRCNEQHILSDYLAHFMRSSVFRSQYLQIMRQSTRNQVPITKQREFYHVIPPLAEQKTVVDKLDIVFQNGRRLESIYQQKLEAFGELKRSVLQKAFAGALNIRLNEALPEAAQ